MKSNIQTNLVGRGCYVNNVSHHPVWGRGVSKQPDRTVEYKIVAVYLVDGEDMPTVALEKFKLGGGESDIIRMYLDSIVLF